MEATLGQLRLTKEVWASVGLSGSTSVLAVLAAAAVLLGTTDPDTPVISQRVLDAIGHLNMRPPTRSIQQVIFTGTSTFKGAAKPAVSRIRWTGRTISGLTQTEERNSNDGDYASDWQMNGLIKFNHSAFIAPPYKSQTFSNIVEEVIFSGDWRNLSVGSSIGYKTKEIFFDGRTGKSQRISEDQTCEIVAAGKAADFFPALQGRSKILKCSYINLGEKIISNVIFLEDYSWFFRIDESKNNFFYFQSHMVSITQ